MSTLHVRPYRPTDHDGVSALRGSSEADLSATVPQNFYDDLGTIEATYEGGAFLVAELDGTVIAMGGLLATGEIVRMRVLSEHRRKGIASAILTALITRARELGMDRVFLHTLTEQRAARQLYLAHRFRETGQGEIHGNSVVGYECVLRQAGS